MLQLRTKDLQDPAGDRAGGGFGTLVGGVFGHQGVGGFEGQGLVYGGGFGQLGTQALGVLAVGAFVLPVTGLAWFAIKKTIGIRVTEEEEMIGLDISEHGMEAYPAPAEREGLAHATGAAAHTRTDALPNAAARSSL